VSQHTLATGRAATLIKLAFAAGAKLSAAFIAFGLTALVTRSMPNDEAGLFLLGFSILAVLSVFFRLGLDNVILRFLSAHGTDAFAQEKLNRGLLWVSTVVIPSTVLGMLFSEQIATHIFNKPAFGPVLFWMLLALPAMAIFFLISMAFQAQHRVVVTTVFQNLGISTVFVAAFGYLWYEQPEVLNAITAAQIYAGAAGVIFLAALITWFSQKGISFNVTGYKDKELSSASFNLWVAACMSLAVQWSGILISGAVLRAEDVALLSAAQRTAMLASFVLMVVNMVVAPRYARMWKEKDLKRIKRLAKWSTRSMTLMVLPVVTILIVYSSEILSMFGQDFAGGANLLIIMVLGQLVNVGTGSVGYLLNMTGNEAIYRALTIISGVFGMLLAYFLISTLGVLGGALAFTLSGIFQNILGVIAVRKKLGFWVVL
jgi:O-antigen/teichoic acid export membrane protein